MKKRLPYLFFFLSFVFFSQVVAQAQSFKVVGYLPYYRFGFNEQIDYEKLTHLNISFANPDAQGNLSISGQDPTPVIARAHAHDVEVFLALAGGALTAEWEAAWKNLTRPENRSAFIHKIVDYTLKNDYQGIDVDLEFTHVDENYSGFVLELKDSLDVYNLPMSAALPGTIRYPEITDEALAAFDWINMMVYNLTGPWAPNDPGQHAPLSFANNAIFYWAFVQGVDPDRLTLGLPFYGYNFADPSNVTAVTYRTMVTANTEYAYRDQVGQAYYNGIPTIKEKTQLALNRVGGVMAWELGQDAMGDLREYSLLNAIDETINLFVDTDEPTTTQPVTVYPNPFQHEIIIEGLAPGEQSIWLADFTGRRLFSRTIKTNVQSFRLDLPELPAGMYVLSVSDGSVVASRRVVKR